MIRQVEMYMMNIRENLDLKIDVCLSNLTSLNEKVQAAEKELFACFATIRAQKKHPLPARHAQ